LKLLGILVPSEQMQTILGLTIPSIHIRVARLWRKKGEQEISELINNHSEIVLDTVKALSQYLDIILKKKAEERLQEEENTIAERVLALESEADRSEERIDEKLRETALPVTSSERYSLVEKIDSIADRSEIVIRKFRLIDESIRLEIKEKLCEMGHYCLEATEAVAKSTQFLGSDFDSALIEAQKVRPIRNKNRNIEFQTLKLITQYKMRTSTFVILYDVIQLLGRIGDLTNQVAHAIISLTIKYRS
jgi:uncharacterized protein Yka (UPF0111/DUF47 family)